MKIFLDVCCLNRPFDKRDQARIRVEIQAIEEILHSCEDKTFKLMTSDSLEAEINKDPNVERKERVVGLLSLATIKVKHSENLQQKIQALMQLGFTTYDAAHIASAEKGNADVFLSTDDRLVRRAKKHKDYIKVTVDNPAAWLLNVNEHNDNA